MLGGVLSGSKFGSDVRQWQSPLKEAQSRSEPADLGQTFIAIDPLAFGLGFESRMSQLIEQMRSLHPGEGQPAVMVPGEPESNAFREQLSSGVRLHDSLVAELAQLAESLKVKPLTVENPV